MVTSGGHFVFQRHIKPRLTPPQQQNIQGQAYTPDEILSSRCNIGTTNQHIKADPDQDDEGEDDRSCKQIARERTKQARKSPVFERLLDE